MPQVGFVSFQSDKYPLMLIARLNYLLKLGKKHINRLNCNEKC